MIELTKSADELREEIREMTLDQVTAQMALCDRASKSMTDQESQRVIFAFMLELKEEVDSRIHAQ